MKLQQLLLILSFASGFLMSAAIPIQAQNASSVTNNNNENVEIDVQESGSQSQGQSSNGNTSEVRITDEEAEDNFWSNGYRGRVSIPPGSASLTCGEQTISFSRSGGFGLGVGAAGINLSDNRGELPPEFNSSLEAIRQCAKEKNISEIVDKYLELSRIDTAIANTYLRTVSPEVYATFFVENSKDKVQILSETTFSHLSKNLRNNEFDRVLEWQDNYHSAALKEQRMELQESQELRAAETDKRLVELEVFELERRAKEVEAIIRQKQSQLNNLLEQYQENK